MQKIKDLQETADKHLDKAEDLVDKFKEQMDQTKSSFEETKEKLVEQLDAFEEKAKETLDDLVADVDKFMEDGEKTVEDLLDSAKEMTDKAADLLGNQFAEMVVEKLLENAGPLKDAFDAIKSATGDSQDSMLGKFTDIAKQVEEVGNILESIKPALDIIESLV